MELLKGRGTVDFTFRVARTWRAKGPEGLKWELSPEGRVEARLLCAGSAFLGNFRVPKAHYGVQWTVVGRVSSASNREIGPAILQARAGSWIKYTWVDMATGDFSPREALLSTWAGFRDLFDPEEILLAGSRQICQLTWSGRFRLGVRLDLDLVRGWQVGTQFGPLELEARLRAGLDLAVQARLEREGTYALRVQRKGERILLTLRRQDSRDRMVGIEVSAFGTSRAGLRLAPKLVDPVLEPVRDRLDDALKRRLELLMSVDFARWTRRKSLIEVEWSNPKQREFSRTYQNILSGNLPSAVPGCKISSRMEALRGRRTTLKVNFLNWFTLGTERTEEHQTSCRVDPLGHLLVEEGWQVEETRYRWDERQFFRLLAERRQGAASGLNWFRQEEGRVSHSEFLRLLKPALHVGAIPTASIPNSSAFPLTLKMTWVTEIDRKGIETLRASTQEERWGALVRSMELAEPQRYRPGSFWRDWIDSEELRNLFDRDPVQSHLQSLYPVGGRSDAQRLHVLGEYRRRRRFLRLFSAWAGDEEGDPTELVRQGLNTPIFLFVHLLCPPEHRRSAVVLTGGLEVVWGDPGLV